MDLKEYIQKNTKIRSYNDDLKFLPRRYGLGFRFEEKKIDKNILINKRMRNYEISENTEKTVKLRKIIGMSFNNRK